MAGHNKWSQIKRQKAVTDRKRGQVFSKFAKHISLAAKEGGDPELNFKLRLLVERAKAADMPNENIERAIKRGTGENTGGASINSVLYEALGPGGSVFIIEAATDNNNRTLSELKQVLNKNNGRLADNGSVMWMFKQKGLILIDRKNLNEEKINDLTLTAIDTGALDVQEREEGLEIYTKPRDLAKVKEKIQGQNVEVETAELFWGTDQNISPDRKDYEKISNLSRAIEDLDDVVAIHDNLA